MTKVTAVLVTTEFRGVFFGYADLLEREKLPDEILLARARNCITWSDDIGGFLGLAATGPNKSCIVGAEVSELILFKITSVAIVSDAAINAWHNA